MSTIERAAAKLGRVLKGADDGKAAGRQRSPTPGRAGNVGGGKSTARQPLVAGNRLPGALDDELSDPAVGGAYRVLDLSRLTASGFVTRDNAKTMLASDFRRVKRPLLLKMKAEEGRAPAANPLNLILVTSALPGEGKTFVSINLALSIAAEVDSSVLLVDGDALKGDIAKVLGIEYQTGLVDVVQEHRHAEGAIIGTNIEGLSVLLAGHIDDSPDELFASEMMQQTLLELAHQDEHRVVVIDAPPLMAGTMASVLARVCGQVVMVVEAERTPQATVAEAVNLIGGCESISLMLNKATRRSPEQLNYGYGYGYGYGSDQAG
jgi:protein-tyrosine kinase